MWCCMALVDEWRDDRFRSRALRADATPRGERPHAAISIEARAQVRSAKKESSNLGSLYDYSPMKHVHHNYRGCAAYVIATTRINHFATNELPHPQLEDALGFLPITNPDRIRSDS